MKINQINFKRILKIAIVIIAVAALAVVGYRYLTRPVQTWTPSSFEGRNPDKVAAKDNGQRYWVGENVGNGFYVTDETVTSGDKKTYCVNGGVTSDNASFTLGDASFEAKNGYFTKCASQTVNDKRQLTFTVTSGQVQIYRVDRKR